MFVSVKGSEETHVVPSSSASSILSLRKKITNMIEDKARLHLVLSLDPPPQVTEQEAQEPQGPTSQSTEENIKLALFSF